MARNKDIQKPEDIETLFNSYRKWCNENPIIQQVPNYGKLLSVPHTRPLTVKGFYAYAKQNHAVSLNHYFDNTNNGYNDYSVVCSDIKTAIHSELITLALVGIVKEGLTAKIVGLNETLDITTTAKNFSEPILIHIHE